ncbi:type IV secretory system conjugative DNA transfer family protein [Actinomadura sp. 6N118]|uniref:type IV secretory system conjugative DNA transfer family protein n=1 Tax=Actinomadura sp. 6N118 TaxID=3375151 RepID=UPI00378A0CA7
MLKLNRESVPKQPKPSGSLARSGPEESGIGIIAVAAANALLGLLGWSSGWLGALITRGSPAPGMGFTDLMLFPAYLVWNLGDAKAVWPESQRAALGSNTAFWIIYLTMIVLFAAVVGLVALKVVGHRRQWRVRARQRERDFSPIWAKPKDVAPLGIESKDELRGRVYLGDLVGRGKTQLATPRYTSIAVIAPTGSAKTAKYVVPTILRWPDAIYVTSTKSDVADLTIPHRADRPVYILDPSGDWPEQYRKYLCAWSPLMEVDSYADAEKVAGWLAESAQASDDPKIRFFISLTQIALAPMLWIARKYDKTLQDVSDWVSYDRFDEVEDLLDEYKNSGRLPKNALADWAMARRAVTATKKRSNELFGNICGNVDFILRPFVSAQLAETMEIKFDVHGRPYSPHGRPVLDMGKVLAEGGTIYAVSDEEEQELLLPVFVCATQSFLRACRKLQQRSGTGPLKNPPLLLLEEAANVAPLPTLDKMVATYRGYGIVIMSIWQDEAQVNTIYGTRAPTVLGNHTTRVYLPGSSDDKTLARLSRLIGEQPIATQSAMAMPSDRSSEVAVSISESSQDIEIAPVEYLRTLPADVAVVLSGRLPAMKVSSLPWFRDQQMRARVGEETCERYDSAFK